MSVIFSGGSPLRLAGRSWACSLVVRASGSIAGSSRRQRATRDPPQYVPSLHRAPPRRSLCRRASGVNARRRGWPQSHGGLRAEARFGPRRSRRPAVGDSSECSVSLWPSPVPPTLYHSPGRSTRPAGRSPCSEPARDGRFCVRCSGRWATASLAGTGRRRHRWAARRSTCRPARHGSIRITKLETILVKPRWLFLKVHTDEGIVGLGEPVTEGRALTCAEAIKEIEPYLDRAGRAACRPPLAGHLPPRVLSRRPDPHQRAVGHRPGAVGHQGQGARRARLRAARAARRATASASTRTRAPSRRSRRRRRRGSPRSRPGRI